MKETNLLDLPTRLAGINADIRDFEQRYSRKTDSAKLIAVSKTKPDSLIREAFNQGQRRFGENYLQEALGKQETLSDLDIEWHFIGAIQSRKARDVARNFDWVHCVDRAKLANKLDTARADLSEPLNVLIQVNLQGESSKAGVSPDEAHTLAELIHSLPNLRLRGLMIIPEPEAALEKQRAVFAKARQLLARLNDLEQNQAHIELDAKSANEMTELSMGMTNDLEAAVAEGATMVRIGTAIFGGRAPK